MPILEDVGEATQVRVSASAPLELMWILHNLQAKHVLNGPYTSLERLRADMQPKVASFWADGVRGYTETIVLAERSGTTLDLDLDRYFEKLDEAIGMVDDGTGYRTLLDRPHVWPGRPELEELAESALAEGRMVLSPGWFFGVIHVVEVDGTVYLGRGVRTEDQDAVRRETATRVAGNLKALADPTRLGILLWLAKHPASVTEIASHFELSQPTVSGHIQLLRDAGLLEDRLAGRRSKLIVARERLKGLIGDAEESMLRLFPHE